LHVILHSNNQCINQGAACHWPLARNYLL